LKFCDHLIYKSKNYDIFGKSFKIDNLDVLNSLKKTYYMLIIKLHKKIFLILNVSLERHPNKIR